VVTIGARLHPPPMFFASRTIYTMVKRSNFREKPESIITVHLNVKLKISASHVTRYDRFNQLDRNQLITIIPRTGDVMCVTFLYLPRQVPTNIYALLKYHL